MRTRYLLKLILKLILISPNIQPPMMTLQLKTSINLRPILFYWEQFFLINFNSYVLWFFQMKVFSYFAPAGIAKISLACTYERLSSTGQVRASTSALQEVWSQIRAVQVRIWNFNLYFVINSIKWRLNMYIKIPYEKFG